MLPLIMSSYDPRLLTRSSSTHRHKPLRWDYRPTPLRAGLFNEYSFAPTFTSTCRLYSGLLRKDIATSSLLPTPTWQLYCGPRFLLSTPTWQLYCGPLAKYCFFVPTVTPTWQLYCGLLRKDIAVPLLLSTPTWQLYCEPLYLPSYSACYSQKYCSFSSPWLRPQLLSRKLIAQDNKNMAGKQLDMTRYRAIRELSSYRPHAHHSISVAWRTTRSRRWPEGTPTQI